MAPIPLLGRLSLCVFGPPFVAVPPADDRPLGSREHLTLLGGLFFLLFEGVISVLTMVSIQVTTTIRWKLVDITATVLRYAGTTNLGD